MRTSRSGLNSKLYSRCRLDSAQKEFETLSALQNHALSIEVEHKASPAAKEPKGDYGRRAEWRDNRPPRSRGRFNKESPSLSAMEKGDKDREWVCRRLSRFCPFCMFWWCYFENDP